MSYFKLTYCYSLKYRKKNKIGLSMHVISAKTIQDALKIIIQSNLSSKDRDLMQANLQKLDMRIEHNKALIERRKKGQGGIIWK